MTTFARWSGIVHTNLSKSHPKFKYSQAREVLAAALGHRTYASLRTLDFAALHERTKYVLLDDELALNRAAGLGFPVTLEEWQSAAKELTPSGISGDRWMIRQQSMVSAARVTFEDASHPVLHEIAKRVGTKDGHWATSAHRVLDDGTLPDELTFLVHGEVRAFNEELPLAMPVVAEVMFRRVGKGLYAEGELLQVEQRGTPRVYEPDFDGDFYWMSED